MTEASARRRRRWIVPAAMLVALLAFFALNCARVVRQASLDEARPADVIVVFGAAEYSGHPSPIYRARLDHALALYRRGLAYLIITTGGSGGDPRFTEGEVGRNYLASFEVPDHDLIAETQGDNTAESAVRVAAIMRTNGMRSCIAVTDPYHLFRAKRLLEAEGFAVYASGRPAPASTRLSRTGRVLHEAASYTMWRMYLTRW